MKIGIAGYGFVGQAVHSCMKDDCRPVIHDPPKGIGEFKDLFSCEVIFCCLPTPTKSGAQIFHDYADFLQGMVGYDGLLIIKSTVLYHYIQAYITSEHSYNIVINPEFLNQNDFKNDFYEQKVIVLGGRVDHCRLAERVYRKNFKFKSKVEFEYCSVKEAIELKYTHNVYHAYKVLYWNFIHERCGNQRKLFSLYSKITGNTNELAQIYADGTPGYGGACFPKDVKAFNFEMSHELTEFMIKYNARLRKDFPEDER
jgi:UDP-glucose 6-dehydrogenase